MAKVIVSATVKDEVVNIDVVVQGYKVSVTGQPDQIVPNPTATFEGVVPGDYTASVSLIDAAGVVIGGTQSATFIIAPTTKAVSVPDVVSVVVS